MLHMEGKECAQTNEKTQHTMWVTLGGHSDAEEMSRGKAILCPWRRLASNGEPLESVKQENVGESTLTAPGE